MAKRSRGSTSRPGQRPPLQRQPARAPAPPATTTAAPRPIGLTDEEEARAAALEAAIVAEERQADAASKRSKTQTTVEPARRTSSSLEISAAEEYAYVARDVRRIAIVGGGLVVFLLVLWVVSQVAGVGPF